ncbi:MAG: hypothetical protein ABIJ30_02235 [bacterium]
MARVQATTEIEGISISRHHLRLMEKVAEGKLKSDDLISEYTKRIIRLSQNGH